MLDNHPANRYDTVNERCFMSTCQNCNQESDKLHTFYPTGKDGVTFDAVESAKHKQKVCLPCLGKLQAPSFRVSFDPVYAFQNWIYTKNSVIFQHLNEVKIYAFPFRNKHDGDYWAFAIVTNGDFFDIKEAHVNYEIQNGHYPVKITEDELKELAKKVFNEKKDKPYPYGYVPSDKYPNESKYYQRLAETMSKELNG